MTKERTRESDSRRMRRKHPERARRDPSTTRRNRATEGDVSPKRPAERASNPTFTDLDCLILDLCIRSDGESDALTIGLLHAQLLRDERERKVPLDREPSSKDSIPGGSPCGSDSVISGDPSSVRLRYRRPNR